MLHNKIGFLMQAWKHFYKLIQMEMADPIDAVPIHPHRTIASILNDQCRDNYFVALSYLYFFFGQKQQISTTSQMPHYYSSDWMCVVSVWEARIVVN